MVGKETFISQEASCRTPPSHTSPRSEDTLPLERSSQSFDDLEAEGSGESANQTRQCFNLKTNAKDLNAWMAVIGLEKDSKETSAAKKGGKDALVVSRMPSIRQSSRLLATAAATVNGFPLLPWEEGHRVEWHIGGLQLDKKLLEVRYKGIMVPKGRYLDSPRFQVMGEDGFLRFWLNGYFTTNLRKNLVRDKDLFSGGLSLDAWCAVGLYMPQGTHLRLRFFIGNEKSDIRECYWHAGNKEQQIWMPESGEPPDLEAGVTMGVEVLANYRHLKPGEAHVQRSSREALAIMTTPRRKASHLRASSTLSDVNMADDVMGMMSARKAAGLKLPSPRYMCATTG